MDFAAARLLVVDDNPDNREMLSRRLKRLGYGDVSLAADGEEALAMNNEAAFDAILLDVMMPRKSGIEVLEQLRSEANQLGPEAIDRGEGEPAAIESKRAVAPSGGE